VFDKLHKLCPRWMVFTRLFSLQSVTVVLFQCKIHRSLTSIQCGAKQRRIFICSIQMWAMSFCGCLVKYCGNVGR